jgi:hypothetical protein
MIDWLLNWDSASRHPIRAAGVSAVLAGVGATLVAYFRFVDENLAFAIVVGAGASALAFVFVARRATASTSPEDRTRLAMSLARASVFEVFLLVAGGIFGIAALAAGVWGLAIPAVIFVGLAGVLVLLRRSARPS